MPNRRRRDTPENNVLHVTGLPDDVTEREVRHPFMPFEGMRDVRLKNINRNYVAFVEFDTIRQATYCMDMLSGYPFSERSDGLSIDYGKHRSRRDRGDRDRDDRGRGRDDRDDRGRGREDRDKVRDDRDRGASNDTERKEPENTVW